MKAYRAYELYLAVKLHFTSETYDCIHFNYKTSASLNSFIARRDKYYFEKIAKRYQTDDQLVKVYVASFLEDITWIGDIVDNDPQTFYVWESKIERLSFQFQRDIRTLFQSGKSFEEIFIKSKDGRYPLIIQNYLEDDISLETLVIFNSLTKNLEMAPVFDELVWPNLLLKIKKYSKFLSINKAKYTTLFQKTVANII